MSECILKHCKLNRRNGHCSDAFPYVCMQVKKYRYVTFDIVISVFLHGNLYSDVYTCNRFSFIGRTVFVNDD